MAKFTLEEISEIKGVIKFYYLIIDGVNGYKEFENAIIAEGKWDHELNSIQAIMEQVTDRKSLTEKKFKDITPKKDSVKEYEIKSKNLRVYLFHEKRKGRIIVVGAKKYPKSQNKDILKFRRIKKEYINSL